MTSSCGRLGELGYRFQFITLAGFRSLNHAMFSLARGYAQDGMTSYVALQQAEFADQAKGYTATRHQAEVGMSPCTPSTYAVTPVGTGYFDMDASALNPGSETTALAGSTETAQFH